MEEKRTVSGSSNASNTLEVSGTGTTVTAEAVCQCTEPKMEKIMVEQVLGAEMAQRVVEFDMFVPQRKPDIEQVVDVYVKDVEITSVDVIKNKVIVRGDMEVKVMYVAALPNQPVHAFEKSHVRFTRDIEVMGAEPDMKVTSDVTIEFVDYSFDENEPRKVHITIVLKVWVRVVSTVEIDAYTLTPIDEVGQIEYTTATASTGSASASHAGDTISASEVGGGEIAGYGAQNILVTGPMTPTAGTAVAGVSGTATVSGNSVNVRTGPGTNFPVVTKVNKGDKVTVKEQAFGWYRVVLADGVTTGWIASWLVTMDAPKG